MFPSHVTCAFSVSRHEGWLSRAIQWLIQLPPSSSFHSCSHWYFLDYVLKCVQTVKARAGRWGEGCSLVEQHCHLMVQVHPYKVCSDAPIHSVQGCKLQAHVSPTAENPNKQTLPVCSQPSKWRAFTRISLKIGFSDTYQQPLASPVSPMTILLLSLHQSALQISSVNSHFLKLH